MNILHKSIDIIDIESEKVQKKDIPEDINNYINLLVLFAENNKRVKEYREKASATQVISNIKNIIILSEDIEKNEEKILENALEISNRLLEKEVNAQDKVKHLTDMKRGSIVQVLLQNQDDEDKYTYLIAKVDHTDFFDDKVYNLHSGFSAKKQDIWKTCLFDLSRNDDEITINSAKVYLDYKVAYWTGEFLELRELKDDELNTKNLFDSIDKVLMAQIKRKSYEDYVILRNLTLGYMKTERLINYDKMIEDLFEKYTPQNKTSIDDKRFNDMITKLKDLPKEEKFELQFTLKPSAIPARKLSTKIKINNFSNLELIDHVANLKKEIKTFSEEDGNRYVKMKVENDELYNMFCEENYTAEVEAAATS